ncbi:DnaB-like helicase C-terminal domain-containing protein (plasmid) [Ralstonia sp. 25C]|uniref:DnaB-like helicase C-terminal domain-containing protein n=1 Tax=Ralstonia sp. 25C TaxID=3447363 RepID=UPI003F752DB5
MKSENPISVFISYSHKDESFREALEEHLSTLRRNGVIASWTDRRILPGDRWAEEIDKNIRTADIVLLLVSPSFTSSNYCMEQELAIALDRHQDESAVLIPIFVRPADVNGLPFMAIQGLPKDAEPVSIWPNQDLAWLDVTKGIRAVAEQLRGRKRRRDEPAELTSLQESLTEYVEGIDRFYQSDLELQGIPTQLTDLDRLTGGLRGGQLITLASRPAMGKTNLALTIASAVAGISLPVAIFSTKTSKREITERLLTVGGKLNFMRLASGSLSDSDWPALVHAVQKLSESTLLLDDTTRLSLEALERSCRNAREKYGALALLVIDSLHFIEHEGTAQPRSGPVARFLKRLARDLDCCILVTTSVSRTAEQRPNKRPFLSDLAEWAEFAEESDVLLFLYVDEFYNPDGEAKGTAEIIVARNNHGPIATVRVSRDSATGAFRNFVGEMG